MGANLLCNFRYRGTGRFRLLYKRIVIKHGVPKDVFVIERQEEDFLGDPRWVVYRVFEDPQKDQGSGDDASCHDMLLELVCKLLLTSAPLASAHRLGGWEAVSDIQRKLGPDEDII